jgi:hypothetical protein
LPDEAQAMEVVQLRDRLAEAEEARREARAKLGAAQADARRLEDQLAGLEQALDAARGCACDTCISLQASVGAMCLPSWLMWPVLPATLLSFVRMCGLCSWQHRASSFCAHHGGMAPGTTGLSICAHMACGCI